MATKISKCYEWARVGRNPSTFNLLQRASRAASVIIALQVQEKETISSDGGAHAASTSPAAARDNS